MEEDAGGAPRAAGGGIVAGAGTVAASVTAAVEQITGRGAQFMAISNTGLCLDDIQGALAQALDTTGARVIFTDLPAGSCTMAVRRMIRERPGVLLVTGVNLSLLLDFAMQDFDDPAQAVQTAVDRGRASMVVHGAVVANA